MGEIQRLCDWVSARQTHGKLLNARKWVDVMVTIVSTGFPDATFERYWESGLRRRFDKVSIVGRCHRMEEARDHFTSASIHESFTAIRIEMGTTTTPLL
jgi:hypothetical protein